MISLGIKNYLQNIVRNILITIQVAIILLMLIAGISIVKSQYKMLSPLLSYLDKEGGFISNLNVIDYDVKLTKNLQGIDKVLQTWNKTLYINDDKTADVFLYPPKLSTESIGELSEGVWFDQVDSEDVDGIPVVVSSYTGYHPGTTIILFSKSGCAGKRISLYVTGVLADDSYVFGIRKNNYDSLDEDYQTAFYTKLEGEDAERYLFLGSIKKWKAVGYKYKDVFQGLITYKDNITQEQKQHNTVALSKKGAIITMDKFKTNSMEKFREKLIVLLPVLLAVFLLSFTSIVSSCHINVMNSYHEYGIFYLCGSRWKQCVQIGFVSGVLISAGAVILTITGYNVFHVFVKGNFYMYFGKWQLVAIILAIAGFIILQMALVYYKLRKVTPVEALKM